MATRDDELWLSFGVMGGFQQPQGHLQVISNMVDFKMGPQEALDALRFKVAVENVDDPKIQHGSLCVSHCDGHHLSRSAISTVREITTSNRLIAKAAPRFVSIATKTARGNV